MKTTYFMLLFFTQYIHAASYNLEDANRRTNAKQLSLGDLRCSYEFNTSNYVEVTTYIPYEMISLHQNVFFGNFFFQNCSWKLKLNQNGNSDLFETGLSFGAEKKLSEHLCAGVQLHYNALESANRMKGAILFAELSMQWMLTPNYLFAVKIMNPSAAKQNINKNWVASTSTTDVGCHIKLGKQCNTFAEIHFNVHEQPILRMGLAYQLTNQLVLCTGAHTNSFQPTWGVGIKKGRWDGFYGGSYHSILGISSAVSMSFSW